jgi:hypothetical protein
MKVTFLKTDHDQKCTMTYISQESYFMLERLKMGKDCCDNFQAKLGLTVGVLTGIGNQHELADADVIVLDVNECVEMILPPMPKQGKSYYMHKNTSYLIMIIASKKFNQFEITKTSFSFKKGDVKFSSTGMININITCVDVNGIEGDLFSPEIIKNLIIQFNRYFSRQYENHLSRDNAGYLEDRDGVDASSELRKPVCVRWIAPIFDFINIFRTKIRFFAHCRRSRISRMRSIQPDF